ncbi:MAG TPA: HNH endonuclease signature motif containing protein [Candidatus Binatia bacterium]|nr:HNH endonuclease signature motif containing protein [Candidatus Binatia bacterium]
MKEVESRVRLTPPARFGGGRTHAPRRCDGAYPTEQRLDVKTEGSLKGLKMLLFLWRQQQGRCPVCQERITKLTGWQTHHLIWKSHGGMDCASNLILLHPGCHQEVHRQKLVVVKPRPEKGVGKA